MKIRKPMVTTAPATAHASAHVDALALTHASPQPIVVTRVDGVDTQAGTSTRARAGAGAHAVLHGLQMLSPSTSPSMSTLKAGAVGVLMTLAVLVGAPSAHAQTVPAVAGQKLDVRLPATTGPPVWTQDTLPQNASAFDLSMYHVKNSRTAALGELSTDDVTRVAFDNFLMRLQSASQTNAMGLAVSASQGHPGDRPLTPSQEREVQRAATSLLLELPVAQLAPGVADHLQSVLEQHGLHGRTLATARLKDLGDVSKDLALDWLKQLKGDNASAYYGLVAGAAVALGGTLYLQGTSALDKVGIAPTLKVGLFSDHVHARVRLDVGAHFKDPTITTGVEFVQPLVVDDRTWTATVGVSSVLAGPTLDHLKAQGLTLSGSLSGTTAQGVVINLSASQGLLHQKDFSGALSIGYQPRKDLDVFAFVAKEGGVRTGLGLRLSF